MLRRFRDQDAAIAEPDALADARFQLRRCPQLAGEAQFADGRRALRERFSGERGDDAESDGKVSAAFFAPEIGMIPLSGAPPRICMRSIPVLWSNRPVGAAARRPRAPLRPSLA